MKRIYNLKTVLPHVLIGLLLIFVAYMGSAQTPESIGTSSNDIGKSYTAGTRIITGLPKYFPDTVKNETLFAMDKNNNRLFTWNPKSSRWEVDKIRGNSSSTPRMEVLNSLVFDYTNTILQDSNNFKYYRWDLTANIWNTGLNGSDTIPHTVVTNTYVNSLGFKEIYSGATLPASTTLFQTGNKFLLTTDSTEYTYQGNHVWFSNIVKGTATPLQKVTSGTETFDNSRAVWKNPNINIYGRTIDYTYQNTTWTPSKGFINVVDAGAVGDNVTDNSAVYVKIMSVLPSGGTLFFPAGTYKGILYLAGGVQVQGEGKSSVLTNLTDSSCIVITSSGSITQSGIYIGIAELLIRNLNIVALSGTGNGIELRTQLAARIRGDNLTIQASNIGIWKRTGNIYNSWRNIEIQGYNYCVYAVSDPNNLNHAGAEEYSRCRFIGSSKAAYFLKDVFNGSGAISFLNCFFEGNPGSAVYIKNIGLPDNGVPIRFQDTWNENNAQLDSINIFGYNERCFPFNFQNAKNVVIQGLFLDSINFVNSNATLENCYIAGVIVKDTLSSVVDTKSYIYARNTDSRNESISGFATYVRGSTIINGYQKIQRNVSNGKVKMSFNYADGSILSGFTRDYTKFLYDSCQSVTTNGFTVVSPYFTPTPKKYFVATTTIKFNSITSLSYFGFIYDITTCQFNAANDTLWHTYVGIGVNNYFTGTTFNQVLVINGVCTAKITATQYVEFDNYEDAVDFANSKTFADVNGKTITNYINTNNLKLWNLNGNAGTTAGINFLGTTDATDLVFKTNNTEKVRILSNGNVGIGTLTPSKILEVAGDAKINGITVGTGAANIASNTVVGGSAGSSITSGGIYNSFLGYNAGQSNTSGAFNTLIGSQAGQNNIAGTQNSFIGYSAGLSNTTGTNNSFLGYSAGLSNTTGTNNSFLGIQTGYYNTTGSYNSFLGVSAGQSNTIGTNNTMIGYSAGLSNTTGSYSLLLGYQAGLNNISGSSNTYVGVQSTGVTNESSRSNMLVIGTKNNGTYIFGDSTGAIGIGNTNPSYSALSSAKLSITQNDGGSYLLGGNATIPRISINGMSSGGFVFYDYGGGAFNNGMSQVGGNIGINNLSPAYKLDVLSSANPIRVQGLKQGAATDSIVSDSAGIIRRYGLIGNYVDQTANLTTIITNDTVVTQKAVGASFVYQKSSAADLVNVGVKQKLPQGSLTVTAIGTAQTLVITNGITPLTTTDITHISLWNQIGGAGSKLNLIPTLDFTLTSISGNNINVVLGTSAAVGDKLYVLIK